MESDMKKLVYVLLACMLFACGHDGKDGTNGADGKPGINGEDGKNGTNGHDGKDGQDGVDNRFTKAIICNGELSDTDSDPIWDGVYVYWKAYITTAGDVFA